MIENLTNIYKSSFTGGVSLAKPHTKKKPTQTEVYDPSNKALIYWAPKDFLYYFVYKYNQEFDVNYNMVFQSDLGVINKIAKFFKSFNADFRFHLKGIIDWAFENKQKIISHQSYFTLQSISKYLNEYTQLNISEIENFRPSSESTENEYNFVESMNELYDNKKMSVALKMFGIPIVATYLVNKKSHTLNQVISNISSIDFNDEEMAKIARISIIRSPYHDDMLLKNWRKVFSDKFASFLNETWWRQVDYKGRPPESYSDIVKTDD